MEQLIQASKNRPGVSCRLATIFNERVLGVVIWLVTLKLINFLLCSLFMWKLMQCMILNHQPRRLK